MSYIDLINTAWELREQGIITSHEHDLYCYLLHKCNRLNWKNPFNQSTEIVCAVLGINRNALTNRRNKLKQAGLINFKDGVSKGKPAEYKIMHIGKDTPGDTLSITHADTVANTPGYMLTDTYTKDKKRPDQTRRKEKTKKEIFRKPSLVELQDYCQQRQNSVDAGMFFDFYEAKNWMIGKNRMKDWRAAIRTWERNHKGERHNAADHDNDKRYEMF